MTSEPPKNWKLLLRDGKLKSPYQHYTAIAEGIVGELSGGFTCPPGNAFMGMKTWAASADESANMIRVIGNHLGFTVTSDIRIYNTDQRNLPASIRAVMTLPLLRSERIRVMATQHNNSLDRSGETQ